MDHKNKIYYCIVFLLLMLRVMPLSAQDNLYKTDQFLYGASVYPELMDRQAQLEMLDLFADAGFTVLRLGESAWGNLESGPGEYDFEWLRFFLDEMHKRDLKAILGTCSYVPPLWLTMNHQEVLMKYADGNRANPMGRHAISRNHPVFRDALEKFILAYASEFSEHPAVIGWQLDNEIEQNVGRIDYNRENKKQWLLWLKEEFETVEQLNERLGLKAWGLKVRTFEEVPLPSKSNDGDLPALNLAYLEFDKKNIIDYFKWQKSLLRKAGVKQWITSNWITMNETIADDPAFSEILDVSSVNFYQPTKDDPRYWAWQAWFNNLHRSANNRHEFLVTETRIGPTGNERLWTPAASKPQFITWMLQPVAFGAQGIIHWSGNRFHGGHWPHWGGMLDWSGNPEPDFQWSKELATFFKKWSQTLVNTTVDARAALISDFNQRALLKTFPHTPVENPNEILFEATEAFHRVGLGVDLIPSDKIAKKIPKKYKTLVLAAEPSFEGDKADSQLFRFVNEGGTLIVTPFCGYQTADGLFRKNGFASGLIKLTGNSVETIRLLGEMGDEGRNLVKWEDPTFMPNAFNIKMDGFTEILNVENEDEIIARFETVDKVMNQKPAATLRRIGKGKVVKLAFWPKNDQFTQLIGNLVTRENVLLSNELKEGVQSVPRSDGSFFIINTTSQESKIHLRKNMTDRITSKAIPKEYRLKAYETLWLE